MRVKGRVNLDNNSVTLKPVEMVQVMNSQFRIIDAYNENVAFLGDFS